MIETLPTIGVIALLWLIVILTFICKTEKGVSVAQVQFVLFALGVSIGLISLII